MIIPGPDNPNQENQTMQWTSTPPTEPGHYWVKARGSNEPARVALVRDDGSVLTEGSDEYAWAGGLDWLPGRIEPPANLGGVAPPTEPGHYWATPKGRPGAAPSLTYVRWVVNGDVYFRACGLRGTCDDWSIDWHANSPVAYPGDLGAKREAEGEDVPQPDNSKIPRDPRWVETAPEAEGLYWATPKDNPLGGVLVVRVVSRLNIPFYGVFGFGGGEQDSYGEFQPNDYLWIADPIITPNGEPVWRGFL